MQEQWAAAAFARILGLVLPIAAALSLLLSAVDLWLLVSSSGSGDAASLMARIASPAVGTRGKWFASSAMAMLLAVPLLGYLGLALYYLRARAWRWALLCGAQAVLLLALATVVLLGR